MALAAGTLAVLAGGGLWWSHRPSTPSAIGDVGGSATTTALRPDGILAVSAEQARRSGIAVANAAPATMAPLAELPAVVTPPPGARVAVAAPLPGVVMRTFVVEGDTVRQGQPLATVASREVLSLGGDLARAHARLRVSRANAARLSQLDREGIIAGARADEARALAAEANADVAEKSRILRLVNGHGGSGTYTLVAPIAGRVTTASTQAGSPVDGTTAPYVIDAVGRYEVDAQLPERLVGTVRPGMTVRLGDLRGKVTAVGATIDPATRSARLKAAFPAGSALVAGGAATVAVYGPAPGGAVSVPAAAVVDLDGRDTVFVARPGGFAPRAVRTGGTADGATLVLSGLAASDRVAIAGTSALKALAKAR